MPRAKGQLTFSGLTAVAGFAALLLAAPVAHAQTFQGLGFLESSAGNEWSQATDVSADGSVVVGWALGTHRTRGVGQTFGFRWSGGQMAKLEPAYSQYDYGSIGRGVSSDGNVAVGFSTGAVVGQSRAATRWVGGSGSDIGPQWYAEGWATSADGSVVVGQSSTQTLRWVSDGSPQHIVIGSQSSAYGVSADGSVMVGYAYDPGSRAYRWESGTTEFLPGFSEEGRGEAHGISSDGTIIVGAAVSGGQTRMVRWVNKELEDLGAVGVATGTSDSGHVIVGHNLGSGDARRAMIWTPNRGPEDLRTHLVEQYGLDLTGWALVEASAVSADGSTTVGYGRNPSGYLEAFRASFRGSDDIIVNLAGDEPDANNGDRRCDIDANEPGPQCTLRAAIQHVQAFGIRARIVFDIPGSGIPRIVLQSALAAVTVPLQIDGTTQSGGLVEVRGGAGFDGLRLRGGESSVKGLILNGFTRSGDVGGAAIVITGAGNNSITGNYLGTDAAGNAAIGNWAGILVDGSPDNVIGGAGAEANIISGNEFGVLMRGASGNRLGGNRVGLAANGGFLRNVVGVLIGDNSSNTTVGGAQPNRIASRDYDVVVRAASGTIASTEISGNFIGLSQAGTDAGNPSPTYLGIVAFSAGDGAGMVAGLRIRDNRIAGPHLGIWIAGSGVSEAEVVGNHVGLAFNGSGALPSGRIQDADATTGIRTEAAPGTLIENNLVVGQTWGILAAGSPQFEETTNDGRTSYTLYSPSLPLGNEPGTGNHIRIAGNTVGLNALGTVPAGASPDYGIAVFGGADDIRIENNTVAGHAVTDIWLSESSTLTVAGNRIGTTDGADHGSALGVHVENVETATIGGPGIEARNIISRHSDAGILIEGDSRNINVLNNHIGTDVSGAVAWPNSVGIRVLSPEAGIAGLYIGANIIGGNTAVALDIRNTASTEIVGNRIGVSPNGLAIANGAGLHLANTPALVSGNYIAHNDGTAISIDRAAVQITGNSIYENGSGILYAEAPFSAPAGVIVMRTDPSDQKKVGVFVAVPATGASSQVTIEIFGNRTCENPQGRVLLLSRTVAGNKPLVEFFSTEAWSSFSTMNGFTATATRGNSTSSFSACSEARPFTDSDADGASDLFELLGGDRNGDGIDDVDQPNVATHLSIPVSGDPQVVTLVSAPGTTVQQSVVLTADLPAIAGASYTLGLIAFDIQGVTSGSQTAIEVLLESGRPAEEQAYIKVPRIESAEFRRMPGSGTGDRAEPTATGWRLHLTDGGEWDTDGTANGRIRDPGGPVTFAAAPPADSDDVVVTTPRRGGKGSFDIVCILLLGAFVWWRLGSRSRGKRTVARQFKSLLPVFLLAAVTGCEAGKVETPQIAAPKAADSPAPSAASVHAPLVETHIIDERGFGTSMIAARAQVPGNWKTRGGVGWDRRSECVSNHLRLNWLAVSPDGREAIELMPGMSWQLAGTDIPMNACPPLAIRNTEEFLRAVAQRYPGAQILGFRERPDLAPPAQGMNGARVRSEAGELLIAYQSGSAEVRELLTASLSFSEMQGNLCISSPVVVAYRLVGGDPDPSVSDRFMKSLKLDPQWHARVQEVGMQLVAQISARQRQEIATWHNREMARINARGAADRAQIRAQTNREVAQIYSNVWSNSQAVDDRIQRRTLESIGEYNTYADPAAGGVVRESTQYERVIRTEDGGYISTNDPYLDPAGSQELERVP